MGYRDLFILILKSDRRMEVGLQVVTKVLVSKTGVFPLAVVFL